MHKFILTALSCILFLHAIEAQEVRKKIEASTSELIFPPQAKHAHGSSLVALPNGDLLCAWFMGSGERNADDVQVLGARLKKGSTTWSAPFQLADTYNIPDCNPVLFLNHEGTLFLVWIAVNANKWEQSILRVRSSRNYDGPGAPVWNWQDNIILKPNDNFVSETANKFKMLPEQGTGWSAYAASYDQMIVEAAKDQAKRSIGWMTRIKPLLLGEKKILLPLYSDGFNFSLVAISEDDGQTWHPSLPIVGRGNVQPSIVQRKDGSLVACMRDNGDAPPRVQWSESTDQGESWTPAKKSEIPNTASVELLQLKDGRWVFVGNDITDGRYQLSLYVSEDEGKSWKGKYYLEKEAPQQGSFSYPSLIQSADGYLHISYSYQVDHGGETIKHVRLDPRKVFSP
jgi:predicted neuraminidase